jgi:hypothetical protein
MSAAMNQLRRMVLVNSANVAYREVELDGHIHFIGTQGTGKSTLLRAILFFYSADSRRLGIAREKRPFAEYYFPFADSYIFYEVQAGERRYCVWLYRRQNRLCFRFVDGGYERELVLEGLTVRSESEVMAQAGRLGVKVERPLYNFSEYRDILYGENRSMRRYALMQHGSNYSTIPRTISNIFLNANLDGDYIKRTMIDSLSDESVEINLETNRHHLETARNHYADVMEYQRNEVQAEQIVAMYGSVLELEERLRETAWEIGATVNRAREQARLLSEQEVTQAESERAQKEKLKELNEQYETDRRRIGDRLANVKKDISYTNTLKRKYADLGIDEVQKEAEREPQLRMELNRYEEQRRLLTAKVEQQEQQFEVAKGRLENECAGRIQQLRASLSDYKDQARLEQDEARERLTGESAALQREFDESSRDYVVELVAADKALGELEFELRGLDHTRFFEEERQRLVDRRGELEQELVRTQERQKQCNAAVEHLQREAEDRQKLVAAEGENRLSPLLQQRQQLQDVLASRKADLKGLEGSLLAYLDEEVTHWQQTIGRVVRRDVLLAAGLAPRAAAGSSFYGVELKLEHLECEPLSRAGLLEEIASLEGELAEVAEQIGKQLEANRALSDQLLQRYNQKVRAEQEEARTLSAELFRQERDLERNGLARQELDEKERSKRLELQVNVEERCHRARTKQAELHAVLGRLRGSCDEAISRLSADYERRKKQHNKAVAARCAEMDRLIAEQLQLRDAGLEQLRVERETLLKKQGVNAEKVSELERLMNGLTQQLERIRGHARVVIEYEKDKRDWIDELERFQRERAQLEEKLSQQEERAAHRLRQENFILSELSAQLRLIRADQQRLAEEMAAVKAFERDELFSQFEAYINHHDFSDATDCRNRMDQLKNLAWKFEKQFKQLTENITDFSGRFAEGNCLGFEVHLAGEASFRLFAERLAEFVREQKIITLRTEVTRKYSMVLESIVTETNRLLQREGEVQAVIRKINSDFKASNFVGVVRSIEMRLQESSHRIFQILREICRFQVENNLSYGELNLFNQGGNGNDEKAVELLDQLRLQIGITKSTKLKLEDALDLEFRVCENENDTSWVGHLANVGSNGTDVLVKSMIYINLLHIFKCGGRGATHPAVLHCLVDEVGILHDSNVTHLIQFAAERGICMINGSPNSHNEQDYRHIYIFRKEENKTAITKLLSHAS